MNEHSLLSTAHQLAAGCAAWRKGSDQEGIHCFQRACLLWLDELEQHSPLLDEQNAEAAAKVLGKLLQQLEQTDIVGATDTIEYMLLPLLAPQGGDAP